MPVTAGWRLAGAPPGAERPADGWGEASVPGTVAGAVEAPGGRLDGWDWWFVAPLEVPSAGRATLRLGGVATIYDVFLDGELVHQGQSMFTRCELPLRGDERELAICCRALAPRLAERRRPRARWRTVLVEHGNLRFFRTMLLGRSPGFAPGPAVVGPWRPVQIVVRDPLAAGELRLRSRVEGSDGVLSLTARAPVTRARLVCSRHGGQWAADLRVTPTGELSGELRIPEAERWWPHTHGAPALHDVWLELTSGPETVRQDLGRVGFRELVAGDQLLERGLDVHVNGVPVFCRGAVWTPLSLTSPHAGRDDLAPVLREVVDAGLNLLRVPGTAAYESDDFHDLCDELGILVWQDCMFANLDYPEADPGFMAEVEHEVREELARLAHRPSLTAVCGGSEVAQQVAMLGLDPALAAGPLYGELLPRLVAEAELDAPFVPHSPWGGALPFRPNAGVANYYGVGAYRRPLSDARTAEVRFAAECLAFANLPDDDVLPGAEEPLGRIWKQGVPRDVGSGWDFDDVRDHYLRERYEVDPVDLRWADPQRYRELSRSVTGEVMADVFGEWRRPDSPCTGGCVLWLKDLIPGAGWGLLDHRGRPKAALHHLRRVLAPLAVWLIDEGLNGIVAHVANDHPTGVTGTLRVALYRGAQLVEQAVAELDIPAHGSRRVDVETLLGRFVDPGWTYRFGPPAVDLVSAALERDGAVVAHAVHRPLGGLPERCSAASLGLSARAEGDQLVLRTGYALLGARIEPAGSALEPLFDLEPGRERRIRLASPAAGAPLRLLARNLRGALAIGD